MQISNYLRIGKKPAGSGESAVFQQGILEGFARKTIAFMGHYPMPHGALQIVVVPTRHSQHSATCAGQACHVQILHKGLQHSWASIWPKLLPFQGIFRILEEEVPCDLLRFFDVTEPSINGCKVTASEIGRVYNFFQCGHGLVESTRMIEGDSQRPKKRIRGDGV